MKHLHLPPFFVGRGDLVIVASQITANQMQYPRVAVLVFKNLADQTDCCRIVLEPALHRGLLWEIEFIDPDKTLFLVILFAQRHQPVALEHANEMTLLAGDEFEVFL